MKVKYTRKFAHSDMRVMLNVMLFTNVSPKNDHSHQSQCFVCLFFFLGCGKWERLWDQIPTIMSMSYNIELFGPFYWL
jgi:hypothetical protein